MYQALSTNHEKKCLAFDLQNLNDLLTTTSNYRRQMSVDFRKKRYVSEEKKIKTRIRKMLKMAFVQAGAEVP